VEEGTEKLENAVVGNTSFRGPIGSIKSVCYISLKNIDSNLSGRFLQNKYFLSICCHENNLKDLTATA